MMPTSVLLVVLALAATIHARSPIPRTEYLELSDDTEVPFARNDYRIPTDTVPRHYTLRISPDFESGSFGYDGQVSITVAATQAGVTMINLQSTDLTVISATVTPVAGGANILGSFAYNTTYDSLYLNLNSALNYNAATEELYLVTIIFQGTMRSDMYGFYRSWYTHDGEIRWMGTTQFQATSARAAFPCYDEPRFKATFDVIIERPANYSSWSNMRLQSSVLIAATGRYVDTFHTTPIMSTYLLAFIVAEYDTLPVYNAQNQLTYEVIARPNAISSGQGAYALDVGQRLLAAMDNHTTINFASMDANIKMTQASIPDFSAGAMENWGLLTYREAYLMYSPEHTNSRYQQIIAYILSHEIAHMWFGNLVTCEWWDVLWLNEGFARYYQYFLTHWVETEMGFETRFITEQIHTSMFSDSIETAHALSSNGVVETNGQVSAMFSTITYNKGAAVIRMTEHLLGFEVHRQGLANYLNARSYNTAVPSDLFSALDAVATSTGAIAQYGLGFTVSEYYRTWTEQAGYPILTVHVNHANGDMTIEQRRFNRDVGYSSVNTKWIIPLTFASAGNADFEDTKPTHILTETLSVVNRGSVGDQWVVLNKQQTGFYRVNYDDYTWGLITLALRTNINSIHEYNRAQIVDDVFQFARAGIMTYDRAFNILSFLEFETAYAPWAAAVSAMSFLERRFAGTENLAGLQATFTGWATTLMNELTYYPIANEAWMRSYLRALVAPVMCRMNVAACRTAATLQLNNLINLNTEVPVNSRSWVYCNALRDGTAAQWTYLWNRYQTHEVYTEKIILLETLGCTTDVTSIATYLNAITTDNYIIRPQDYGTAMNAAITGNEANTLIVLNWIQNNFQQYTSTFAVAGYLNTIASRLLNENDIQAYETWVNNNVNVLFTEAVQANLLNGVASTRQLIAWTNTIAADVAQYINNGFQTVELTTAAPEAITDAPTTVLPPVVDPPVVPEYNAASVVVTSFATIIMAAVAGLLANGQ